jgi:hypothetical protein
MAPMLSVSCRIVPETFFSSDIRSLPSTESFSRGCIDSRITNEQEIYPNYPAFESQRGNIKQAGTILIGLEIAGTKKGPTDFTGQTLSCCPRDPSKD